MRRAARAAAAAVLLAGPARAGMFPPSAFSDSAAGTTGAAFLKLPAGARPEALGGTFAAAAEGPEALFWNPAGLARSAGRGRSEAGFSYNALLASSYAGAAAYVRPLSDGRSVVAGGFVYHSAGTLEAFDRFGNSDGSFTPYDLAAEAGWARRFGSLCVGAGAKFIRSDIAGTSGSSFAADLGVTADRVSDIGDGPVDLGASLENLGPPIQVGSVADPLPFALALGARWHANPQFDLDLDGHMPVDASPYPSVGAEFTQPFGEASKGQLRVGYNVARQRGIDGLTGLAAGGGLDLDMLRVDYAWVPFGELGTTHRITLTLRF